MISSNKWVVQLVMDQCEAHGVRYIVLSPGSRNAPFAITADSNPAFETIVIHDERSAAFFALGLAEKTKSPVALCCTSGSATVNYLPAITEAYYRNIPLIVITADRPKAWTDQGDGQTIKQKNIFKEFTKNQFAIDDVPLNDENRWEYERQTAILFNEALGKSKGPVHINVGLNEPLYQTIEKSDSFARIIKNPIENIFSKESFLAIKNELQDQKILVLCGQMEPNPQLLDALSSFSRNNNAVVLVENTSNLQDDRFIHCIDRTLQGINDSNVKEFQPTALITIGGAVISKRIKEFLRACELKIHIKIGYDFPFMDTYKKLSHTLQIDPFHFFTSFNEGPRNLSTNHFYDLWKNRDKMAKMKLESFQINDAKLTDLKVFQQFFDILPKESILHMANSSVVRYCQLFDPSKNVEYYSNRGTSGIDGSLSTASGFAFTHEKQNIIICGDVSFLYDSNSLRLSMPNKNLKILLINNSGGGIFRIIPGAKEANQLEKYFEAQHSFDGSFAQSFGWDYQSVSSKTDLNAKLNEFIAKKSNCILECFTDTHDNPQVLIDFFNYIK